MNIRKQGIRFFLIILFSAVPLWTVVQSISGHKWEKLVAGIFIFLCNFIPVITSKMLMKSNLRLPLTFDFLFLSFMYASTYLGPVHKFYAIFGWWDMVIHFSGGIFGVLLGIYIIKLLKMKGLINTAQLPSFEILASFAFSISITSLWELFEYLSDLLLKTNLMSFDLIDTMSDTLLGMIGSILSSLFFYFIKKRRKA